MRPRRARPKRYKYQGPIPRFQPGDEAGEFNVLEYLGYFAYHPEKLNKLSQEHHWYKVRCSCGNTEIHTQQQLIDVRRHRVCADCIENILKIKESQ